MLASTLTRPDPERAGHQRLARLGRVPGPVGVALVTLAVLAVLDALLRHETRATGDERFYARMAAHPSGPHNFPYAYRVAVPWLVHLLPFAHGFSFMAQALLAIAVAAGALYALLIEFETDPRLAWALSLGFALSPTLLVVLTRRGESIDPASILVIVLGVLFIVRRNLPALALTLLIGVAVRESTLFLIPLAYAIWAQRPFDARALRDVALTSVVPVILYVVIRTSIVAVGQQYIPGYAGPFFKARVDFVRQALAHGNWWLELRRLAYTYGPLWLLAPVALRRDAFARRGLVLVALCVASMTYAFDWGRIVFLAAPVFFLAAAYVLRDRRRLAIATVIALFAVDVGYAVYLQSYGVQHGLDTSVGRSVPVY